YPPFQWFDEPGRNIPVYGYNGQILRALIASLGCEYEVYRTDTWGLPNNGSWNGGMGMLHRDEADLALYPNDANPIKMEVAEHTPTVCPIQLVVMQGRMTKFKKNPFGLVMTLNFEASTKAHLKKLYQRILKYNTLRLPSELFTRSIYYEVIQGWACVIASPQAMSTRAKEICATMRFGEFYISEEAQINFHAVFHMNLQLDAKIRLAISKRIVWMRESGLLSRWWKNSAGDWSGCQGSDMDQHLEALTIDDVE
ncbi:glutamate receptor-like, partial [Tropilaelaps mercedesae]